MVLLFVPLETVKPASVETTGLPGRAKCSHSGSGGMPGQLAAVLHSSLRIGAWAGLLRCSRLWSGQHTLAFSSFSQWEQWEPRHSPRISPCADANRITVGDTHAFAVCAPIPPRVHWCQHRSALCRIASVPPFA